jgi:hypothetical protein
LIIDFFVGESTFSREIAKGKDLDSFSQLHPIVEEHFPWFNMTKKDKMPCHFFVKLKIHTFEVVWTQSFLVGSLYFLTDEIVCISLIEMNVILVIINIQDIHENKGMT